MKDPGARLLLWMVTASLIWCSGTSAAEEAGKENSAKPTVIMETSEGKIRVELFADKAPVTVKNFLQYVDEGFYNGTIFHRAIDGFMIQGGGFTPDMQQKTTRPPIKNEASAELKNELGTLAMARTAVVDSATAQFFINVQNNANLDHRDETPRGFGYAVFGKVVEGMDVVDKIKKVPTTTSGMHQNVPKTPVVIQQVKRGE
jgi:peptidyl-prolyl cis-trans isomerase B (cyclophilin B)